MKKFLLIAFASLAASAAHAIGEVTTPGAGPGGGTRYATDAYPGFDSEDTLLNPEKKEPRWFSWFTGPNRDDPKSQMTYCAELIMDGNYSKAVKQLDALVRNWPASPEAPKAQRMLAETLLSRTLDYEEAFAEYRYILDFYSLQSDYDKVADKLYKIACLMRQEGKTFVFFHFKNTVDVRRAFEACVLRAPGAKWAPEAMLMIGELREEEGKYGEAVKVYENLRNLHPEEKEAKTAFSREADARMVLLRDHGYNRDRCRDTLDFLKMAINACALEDVEKIKGDIAEAQDVLETEAYRAAQFYDSKTRTARSAINAYERFLADYPESVHAEAVKARLEVLKKEGSK